MCTSNSKQNIKNQNTTRDRKHPFLPSSQRSWALIDTSPQASTYMNERNRNNSLEYLTMALDVHT